MVAITFDAGLTADGVPLILKTLEERHLHITFFLTGQFCEKYPQAARAIADAGMELGNHSYSHPYFNKISDQAIHDQLADAEAAIVRTCGRGAKPLFRFPYGADSSRALADVASNGYRPIYWTVDSLDSDGRPKPADYVANRIISRVQPGCITLMHVSFIESAKALPRILDYLASVGLKVVPVSQLVLQAQSSTPAFRQAGAAPPPGRAVRLSRVARTR